MKNIQILKKIASLSLAMTIALGMTLILFFVVFTGVNKAMAAGIYVTGGGTYTIGENFTVNVTASGASFKAVSGSISVTGPVTVIGVTPGNATWMMTPTSKGSFAGLVTSPITSLLVAKITLKGNAAGNGSVKVGEAMLGLSNSVVGSENGSTSFTINRALVMPGTVKITSSTHPDPAVAYEATNIALAWEKATGVNNFAYVLDQVAGTVPAVGLANTNTSASYDNQAVGVYYFHIRAQNGDGWGGTTHFKITIKEPDPKIDATLAKPIISSIEKIKDYTTDVTAGTLSGIILTGKNVAGFTTNITLPGLTPTEGFAMSALTDVNGDWTLTLPFPVKSGFYQASVQGIKEKVLTPVSDQVSFEISVANEGSVRMITAEDKIKPTLANIPAQTVVQVDTVKPGFVKKMADFWGTGKGKVVFGGGILILILGAGAAIWFVGRKKG